MRAGRPAITLLRLLGRGAAWITTLILCAGVFTASVTALSDVIQTTPAFIKDPDGADDPPPSIAAAELETLRSLETAAAPSATF